MPHSCDLVNGSKGFPGPLRGKNDPARVVVAMDGREYSKPWTAVEESNSNLPGGAWDWVATLICSGWHARRDGDAIVLVWAEHCEAGRA